jgi:hypothetical protein
MAPIDNAIAAIDARDSEDDSTLTEIADKFGVDWLTLGGDARAQQPPGRLATHYNRSSTHNKNQSS